MAESLTLATLAGTNFSLINEAGGIVLVEHSYPAPSPEPFYASSADTEGERFLSTRYRNRTISIVCEVFGASSETVLANLQAHVAQIGREGGTLTWVTPGGTTVIFDLVTWTGYEPRFDVAFSVAGTSRVSMEFTAKPFARGAEEVAYTQTTNLITNPKAQDNTTNWSVAASAGIASTALTRETCNWHTGASYCFQVTGINSSGDTTTRTLRLAYKSTGTSGQAVSAQTDYSFSAYVKTVDASADATLGYRWVIIWYDSGGSTLSTSTGSYTQDEGLTDQRVSYSVASPASAAYAYARLEVACTDPGADDTVTFQATAIQMEAASAASEFFDGDSGGCAWTGTANASTSERYAFGVSGVVSAKTFSETTRPVIEVPVTAVPGDVPALGKLEVVEADADDQAWVIWGQQSKYYADNASSAALFIKAEDLTTQGGSTKTAGATGAYGSTVVRNTDLTTSFVSVVSGQLSASSTYLSHIGTFRVFARCYCPTGNTGTVEVALEWAEGDFLRVTRNATVEYESAWEGSFRLLDLGYVSLSQVDTGTQRWEPRIIARSTTVGDELDVDWLMFVPVDDGAGEAAAVYQLSTATTFAARDEFNQTAGALAGKTAASGGTWSGAGDADDFSVETTGKTAQRTAVSDSGASYSGGRFARLGSGTATNVGVGVDFKTTGVGVWHGVFARYTDINNWVAAFMYQEDPNQGALVEVIKRVASTETQIAYSGLLSGYANAEWYTLDFAVYAQGVFAVRVYAQGATPSGAMLVGSDSVLATGGTLATGGYGIVDWHGGASAATRNYDNFKVWTPTPDAAMFASQSLTIHHDKVRREDSGGTLSVKPASYEGDYLLVPPTGPDSRTNRFIVKASRGVPGLAADAGTDDISARLTVTPRFLVVPS